MLGGGGLCIVHWVKPTPPPSFSCAPAPCGQEGRHHPHFTIQMLLRLAAFVIAGLFLLDFIPSLLSFSDNIGQQPYLTHLPPSIFPRTTTL